MNQIDLSIIIPTKNRSRILYKTLLSLKESLSNLHLNYEIIVVNDSKTTKPIIKIDDFTFQLVDNPYLGVASARNHGAKIAQGTILLFIDDDIIVNENCISYCYNFINSHFDSAINTLWEYPINLIEKIKKTKFGNYLINSGFTSYEGYINKQIDRTNELIQIKGIGSYFLCIHKNTFWSVGGYYKDAKAFEDYEISSKLSENNIKFFLYLKGIVLHNEEDKVDLKSWLIRKRKVGESYKVGVSIGFSTLALKYNLNKSLAYMLLWNVKEIIIFLAWITPKHSKFNHIYNKIINILLGTYIYKGFCSK